MHVISRKKLNAFAAIKAAVTGSIASAIRFLVKRILVESDLPRNSSEGSKGIGAEVISRFLTVPGITLNVVKEQLTNLKASGFCP
jgi:hypothetical protein